MRFLLFHRAKIRTRAKNKNKKQNKTKKEGREAEGRGDVLFTDVVCFILTLTLPLQFINLKKCKNNCK